MTLPPKNTPIPLAEVLALCTALGMHNEAAAISADPPPKLFHWDGASMAPEQIGDVNMDLASLPHDIRSWAGYRGDDVGRLKGDLLFAIDMLEKCNAGVNLTMTAFMAVRAGGNVPGTPWRWGFGR